MVLQHHILKEVFVIIKRFWINRQKIINDSIWAHSISNMPKPSYFDWWLIIKICNFLSVLNSPKSPANINWNFPLAIIEMKNNFPCPPPPPNKPPPAFHAKSTNNTVQISPIKQSIVGLIWHLPEPGRTSFNFPHLKCPPRFRHRRRWAAIDFSTWFVSFFVLLLFLTDFFFAEERSVCLRATFRGSLVCLCSVCIGFTWDTQKKHDEKKNETHRNRINVAEWSFFLFCFCFVGKPFWLSSGGKKWEDVPLILEEGTV